MLDGCAALETPVPADVAAALPALIRADNHVQDQHARIGRAARRLGIRRTAAPRYLWLMELKRIWLTRGSLPPFVLAARRAIPRMTESRSAPARHVPIEAAQCP